MAAVRINKVTLAAGLMAIAGAGAAGMPGAAQASTQDEAVAASKFTGFAMTAPDGLAPRQAGTDILIYAGDYAAYDDPEAIAQIVASHGATYRLVTSAELNAMTLDELAGFGAIAWPGGYAGYQSESLTGETRQRIRQAVRERGVGFVGFCAGTFIAVTPEGKDGQAPDYGFSLIGSGDLLPYYYLEDEGTDTAMVQGKFADGTTRDLVWWGGPVVPAFPGGVIARYAAPGHESEPMISQTWAGNGFVVLSGPHPEAPQSWRDKLGLEDSDGLDWDLAWKLIDAARTHVPLPSN